MIARVLVTSSFVASFAHAVLSVSISGMDVLVVRSVAPKAALVLHLTSTYKWYI